MTHQSPTLRSELDWGRIAPLRLRARAVAGGVFTGAHRSARRGAGVEFGGHRNYVPGDDLRWLDRHALMRHARLMIREFETETERAVYLLLDASESMGYRSEGAPGAKLAYAALLAAALSYIAVRERDPVGLSWLGGEHVHTVTPGVGSDAFERVLTTLEDARVAGNAASSTRAWGRAVAPIGGKAPRGSVVVIFSDLLEVPLEAALEVARVAGRSRRVVVARVLDPAEVEFPFDGPLRLRSLESENVIETDGARARRGYLEALEQIEVQWRSRLVDRGGDVLTVVTSDDPVASVRAILGAVAGQRA